MKGMVRRLRNITVVTLCAGALALIVGSGMRSGARADDTDAKNLLKAMSDYLAAQNAISFEFDANYEIVTKEQQKLAFASSGTISLSRPDKIAPRGQAGLPTLRCCLTADVIFNKNRTFILRSMPCTLDRLIDELRDKYNRPLPGADLLLSNVYDALMPDVVSVLDLGSGVIGGVECDHLAFRSSDVDWQIWIAQGDHPYPCRYVITTKFLAAAPQYSIQIRDWKSGDQVGQDNFAFENSTNAKKIDLKDLGDADDLPSQLVKGASQ
jgi:hypothetical protein